MHLQDAEWCYVKKTTHNSLVAQICIETQTAKCFWFGTRAICGISLTDYNLKDIAWSQTLQMVPAEEKCCLQNSEKLQDQPVPVNIKEARWILAAQSKVGWNKKMNVLGSESVWHVWCGPGQDCHDDCTVPTMKYGATCACARNDSSQNKWKFVNM